MEIKLNKPHQFLDKAVEIAAADAGCYARIKWVMPIGARFILVERAMSDTAATFEQHDAVIKALLTKYPDARIRTAMANFDGLPDWEAQRKARVA